MTSEKTSRSRLPGDILVAAVSTPIGVAITWWVQAHTQITVQVWAGTLIAVLTVWALGVLSGLRKSRRRSKAEVS